MQWKHSDPFRRHLGWEFLLHTGQPFMFS
jgi:hypothetical protein